jgi:hypothetical protein
MGLGGFDQIEQTAIRRIRQCVVHLRIPLPLFVLGGAGRGDQGGIHDRALAHRHAPCAEVGFDDLKDLLAQRVFILLVAEGQDRGLIRELVTDQLDAGKAASQARLSCEHHQCLGMAVRYIIEWVLV